MKLHTLILTSTLMVTASLQAMEQKETTLAKTPKTTETAQLINNPQTPSCKDLKTTFCKLPCLVVYKLLCCFQG